MGDPEEDPDGLDPGPRHEARERICLMCGDPFESAWAGHRICGKCKANVRRSGGGYSLEG